MASKPVVYFAGPLFTQSEWQWNKLVADALRKKGLNVILPQEASERMLQRQEPYDSQVLFEGNRLSIDRCDVVVAILDQADTDSGTAWECGYAYKAGRPIVGVRTDMRVTGDDPSTGVNLMLARCYTRMVTLPQEKRDDTIWIVDEIFKAVSLCLPGNS